MLDDQNTEDCECCEPDCIECSQRLADQIEDSETADQIRAIEEQEERALQREIEGGDDDDHDEEDPHGSHPIDEPDEDEE